MSRSNSRRIGRARLPLTLIGAAAIIAIFAPATAFGSTAASDGSTLTYTAVSEVNNVTVSVAGAQLRVQDLGAPITPGTGCSSVGPNEVLCTDAANLSFELGDKGDTATNSTSRTATFRGDTGNDTLIGGSGADTFDEGTPGAGGGNPVNGADSFTGNGGTDEVTYFVRNLSFGIDVTMGDGLPNDGARDTDPGVGVAPEGDNVASDIENATTGSSGDKIIGNDLINVLDGSLGSDTIAGGLGNDTIADSFGANTTVESDPGNGSDDISAGQGGSVTYGPRTDLGPQFTGRTGDVTVTANDNLPNDGEAGAGELDNVRPFGARNLTGGAGNDTLTASESTFNQSNENTLRGGAGNDTLIGLGAEDDLLGEAGNDTLNGGDGNDDLQGGSDYDRLSGDAGADVIDGGLGIDRALYIGNLLPVTITLNNLADDSDGTAGVSTENVRDSVESITGGDAPTGDTLTGSCFNNVLAGMGGNDTLNGDPTTCPLGGYGNDFMGGGMGNDTMLGSETPTDVDGVDRVTYTANTAAQSTNITLDGLANDIDGQSGLDNVGQDIEYLYGGPAVDTFSACGQGATPPAPLPCTPATVAMQGVSFWGGANDDVFFGSDMNDYMDGQAGADEINCEGGDTDMKKADAADAPPAGVSCEFSVP